MGSAVAAVVPLPAGAGSVAAKAPKNLYAWAVAMAHAGNPISEQTLGMALKVPADQATALMSRLVTRGVVHAPNAAGVARAVSPGFGSGFAPTFTQPSVIAPAQPAANDPTSAAKTKLREFAQDALDSKDSAQPEPSDAADQPTKADPA